MSNTKKATSTAATGGSQNKEIAAAIKKAEEQAKTLRNRAKHLGALEELQKVQKDLEEQKEEPPFFSEGYQSRAKFYFEDGRSQIVRISDRRMVNEILDFLMARINEQISKYEAQLTK